MSEAKYEDDAARMAEMPDPDVKVILLGDSAAGKVKDPLEYDQYTSMRLTKCMVDL